MSLHVKLTVANAERSPLFDKVIIHSKSYSKAIPLRTMLWIALCLLTSGEPSKTRLEHTGTISETLDIAKQEVGYTVSEGKASKYGEWYVTYSQEEYFGKPNVPYTGLFISWVLNQTNVGCSGLPISYIPLVQKAAERDFAMISPHFVKRGDLIIFKTSPILMRIAIIESVVNTVDAGNTSQLVYIEGDVNGAVVRDTCLISDALSIIRPDYSDASTSFSFADTCNTNGVPLRNGPDGLYNLIARVPRNARIYHDGYMVGDWIHIEADGNIGWIDKRFSTYYSGARSDDTGWTMTAICIGDGVAFYKYEQGTVDKNTLLTRVNYGDEMLHDGKMSKNNRWAHVKFGEYEGWVNIPFLKF